MPREMRSEWGRRWVFSEAKDRVRRMSRLRRWLLAYFHLNDAAVCVMSEGRKDYHDYQDWEHGYPDHMANDPCKRCGKKFSI